MELNFIQNSYILIHLQRPLLNQNVRHPILWCLIITDQHKLINQIILIATFLPNVSDDEDESIESTLLGYCTACIVWALQACHSVVFVQRASVVRGKNFLFIVRGWINIIHFGYYYLTNLTACQEDRIFVVGFFVLM